MQSSILRISSCYGKISITLLRLAFMRVHSVSSVALVSPSLRNILFPSSSMLLDSPGLLAKL